MREIRRVTLDDALSLLVLYARNADRRAEAAAVRWIGRLALERGAFRLDELRERRSPRMPVA